MSVLLLKQPNTTQRLQGAVLWLIVKSWRLSLEPVYSSGLGAPLVLS